MKKKVLKLRRHKTSLFRFSKGLGRLEQKTEGVENDRAKGNPQFLVRFNNLL